MRFLCQIKKCKKVPNENDIIKLILIQKILYAKYLLFNFKIIQNMDQFILFYKNIFLFEMVVIGAGPIGLRTAIESQLLGAKVTLLEKRTSFSRSSLLGVKRFFVFLTIIDFWTFKSVPTSFTSFKIVYFKHLLSTLCQTLTVWETIYVIGHYYFCLLFHFSTFYWPPSYFLYNFI